MMLQQLIAVIMILGSSMLTAWASGDIAFPAILCMLGLLGVQRRFAWDIRPERHFISPLLLLLLAVLFALHCRYAHVRADQAAAFAWQTIARYFLASMTLILFLRPQDVAGRSPQRRGASGLGIFRSLLPALRAAPARRAAARPGGASELHIAAHEGPGTSEERRATISGLPASLGLFHLASVMAAGQILLLDDRYVAFRVSELLSVILVLLYAMAENSEAWLVKRQAWTSEVSRCTLHASRFTTIAALLLTAVNVGWIGGSLLFRHVEVINFLPAWLSRGTIALETTGAEAARVGFSTSGRLSTVLAIKEDADASPVLTIAGSNPGYLRAMAFETYNQSAWHDLSYREALAPEQNTPFGVLLVGRTFLFRLHEAPASREVTVRHESSVGEAMFTPLGTCFVEAPFPLLLRDDDDTVNSSSVRNRQSYKVGYTAAAVSSLPTGSQLRRLMEPPRQLDPRIRQSANRIFRGCTTTAQKIEAVTRYFHTNYTYALGLEVPPEQDALNYFLLEASSGYCEYFASGAAVLLRLVGVPTRYVTGFLVTERGDDRGTWVARNMDAHAWVEAWDPEHKQWVIVEATTQEGLDDASLADELAHGAGGGRPLLKQLVQALYEYGLLGVVGRLFVSHGLLTGVGLSMAFLGAALFVARRSSRGTSPRRATRDERQAMLHKLLTLMDRQAIRRGYRRQAQETLHAFADRIRGGRSQYAGSVVHTTHDMGQGDGGQRTPCALTTDIRIADWYLQYGGLRYCRVVDPGRVEHLQRLAHELRRSE